jgi:hypothetical protein
MKFIQQDQVAASRFSAGVRGYFQANMLTSWIASDQPGKNYLSEIKRAYTRVFSSILGLNAALMLVSALSGCSGAVGTPPDTTPVAATPLAVSPAAADIFPDVPVTFTITGGKPTYSAFTSNSVVLPVNATVTGTTFTVIPGPVTAETAVDITVRDSLNASAAAKATVKPSTLINQITFTPVGPTGNGCGTNALCSGGDALFSITAALNGVVLRNRAIRFDATQGGFQFVTPGSGTLVTALSINTDEQGGATVRVTAAAGAPTQVATLQTTDVVSGFSRRYSFNIAQVTSGVGILSILPSSAITFTGAKGAVGQDGSCPNGQVDFYVFGGTPPYSAVSPLPGFAVISAPATVSTNGGRFTVQILGCGKTSFIVTDSTGRSIETSLVEGIRGATGDAVTTKLFGVSPMGFTVSCGLGGTISLSGSGSFTSTVVSGGAAFVVSPNADFLPRDVSVFAGSGSVSPAKVTFTSNGTSLTSTITLSGTNAAGSCP